MMFDEDDFFYEDWGAWFRRHLLGIGYALRPNRWNILPRVLWLTVAHALKDREARNRFPTNRPYGDAGLIGICDDLSVETLLEAYSQGIVPFCHIGPMKWWSPHERAVLFFENERIEKSVRRLLRKGTYKVTFDYAFGDVVEACAKPRPGKTPLTWLTPRVMDAYYAMYRAGYAHSVEVWDSKDRLVGGVYGVAIGGAFFGESQFSAVRDASKLASAVLNRHLAAWGFGFRDARRMTDYHEQSGCVPVARETFSVLVRDNVTKPSRTDLWEVDAAIDVATWKPEGVTSSHGAAEPSLVPAFSGR